MKKNEDFEEVKRNTEKMLKKLTASEIALLNASWERNKHKIVGYKEGDEDENE